MKEKITNGFSQESPNVPKSIEDLPIKASNYQTTTDQDISFSAVKIIKAYSCTSMPK